MTDLVFKKFDWVRGSNSGIRPLFGFAIEDYSAKYGFSPEDRKDFWVFGTILDASDDTDYFFTFMDFLRRVGDIRMFVFDINYISNNFVNKLKQQFEVGCKYEELEDCYKDRIVFVLKPTI